VKGFQKEPDLRDTHHLSLSLLHNTNGYAGL
jgi:hypothetical protein